MGSHHVVLGECERSVTHITNRPGPEPASRVWLRAVHGLESIESHDEVVHSGLTHTRRMPLFRSDDANASAWALEPNCVELLLRPYHHCTRYVSLFMSLNLTHPRTESRRKILFLSP